MVTGLGMLWLRLFPLILRAFSAIGERLNGLLVSLAFWNVARDPNHYAQLVLVLIVTLGIGFVVFLPLFLVPPVFAGVLHVIGAIKAYNGEWWNPPFTPQIVT